MKTIAETVPKSSDQPENRAENIPNVEKPYGKPSEEPFKRSKTVRNYVWSHTCRPFFTPQAKLRGS
jgi:hypothetical protein